MLETHVFRSTRKIIWQSVSIVILHLHTQRLRLRLHAPADPSHAHYSQCLAIWITAERRRRGTTESSSAEILEGEIEAAHSPEHEENAGIGSRGVDNRGDVRDVYPCCAAVGYIALIVAGPFRERTCMSGIMVRVAAQDKENDIAPRTVVWRPPKISFISPTVMRQKFQAGLSQRHCHLALDLPRDSHALKSPSTCSDAVERPAATFCEEVFGIGRFWCYQLGD